MCIYSYRSSIQIRPPMSFLVNFNAYHHQYHSTQIKVLISKINIIFFWIRHTNLPTSCTWLVFLYSGKKHLWPVQCVSIKIVWATYKEGLISYLTFCHKLSRPLEQQIGFFLCCKRMKTLQFILPFEHNMQLRDLHTGRHRGIYITCLLETWCRLGSVLPVYLIYVSAGELGPVLHQASRKLQCMWWVELKMFEILDCRIWVVGVFLLWYKIKQMILFSGLISSLLLFLCRK